MCALNALSVFSLRVRHISSVPTTRWIKLRPGRTRRRLDLTIEDRPTSCAVLQIVCTVNCNSTFGKEAVSQSVRVIRCFCRIILSTERENHTIIGPILIGDDFNALAQ